MYTAANSTGATGPARWRRRYFLVSTVGALWWGLILLSHVWLVGFAPETHFLWLYTVIFCSSVTSVFAPYHRFLTWFIACSLLPAAVKAFLSGDALGSIYGALTFAFVWLSAHQARRESENYWDRLGAMPGGSPGHIVISPPMASSTPPYQTHQTSGLIVNR